jgi:hypothetical protein
MSEKCNAAVTRKELTGTTEYRVQMSFVINHHLVSSGSIPPNAIVLVLFVVNISS